MLNLKVLSSSSSGNCYFLYDDEQLIILDCGVDGNIILKNLLELNMDSSAVFITHLHNDHIKGAKNLSSYSKTFFYGNQEVYDILDIHQHQKILISENQKIEIGNFIILPFEVKHNVLNYNFMIYHKKTNTKLAYLTDLGTAEKLEIKDIDYFLVEANYDDSWYQYIPEKEKFKIERTVSDEGHLSIDQTIKFLQKNNNINLKKVILCHLSPGHYEPGAFKFKVLKNFPTIEVFELDPRNKKPQDIKLKQIKNEIDFD